jgi:uncharacterized protein YheU (UPF0270 family)
VNIPAPVEVPADQLPPEILNALIESFILREGTDYGVSEVGLEKKIEQVQRQIAKKDVLIIFDFESESATLITNIEWKKLQKSRQVEEKHWTPDAEV